MSNTYADEPLLAVDIGNTSTHFASMAKGRVTHAFRLPTKGLIEEALPALERRAAFKAPAAAIASVVPSQGRRLRSLLSRRFGLDTHLIGEDLKPPIVNRYSRPRQVGIDRLMNALAAWRRTRRETIIIDFGTAITFDVVSRKGEYLGGIIAPGIEISIEALFQKTALLPKIRLAHPRHVIGRDTVESIRSGCAYGIGGLCDRVVEEIKRKPGFKPFVLATGGYADFMRRYCKAIQATDPDLTLKGIYWTFISRR